MDCSTTHPHVVSSYVRRSMHSFTDFHFGRGSAVRTGPPMLWLGWRWPAWGLWQGGLIGHDERNVQGQKNKCSRWRWGRRWGDERGWVRWWWWGLKRESEGGRGLCRPVVLPLSILDVTGGVRQCQIGSGCSTRCNGFCRLWQKYWGIGRQVLQIVASEYRFYWVKSWVAMLCFSLRYRSRVRMSLMVTKR